MKRSHNRIETKIEHLGNSLGIRIPQEMASELNIEDDTAVYLEVRDGKLIIERKKDLSLEELVNNISEDNKHGLIDFCASVGREKN